MWFGGQMAALFSQLALAIWKMQPDNGWISKEPFLVTYFCLYNGTCTCLPRRRSASAPRPESLKGLRRRGEQRRVFLSPCEAHLSAWCLLQLPEDWTGERAQILLGPGVLPVDSSIPFFPWTRASLASSVPFSVCKSKT